MSSSWRSATANGWRRTTPGLTGRRSVIESVEVFAAQWTGEMILLTSRAALASDLAKLDFCGLFPPSSNTQTVWLGIADSVHAATRQPDLAVVFPGRGQGACTQGHNPARCTRHRSDDCGHLRKRADALRAYVYSHTTSRVDVEPGSRLFRAIWCCCR